MTVTFRTAAVAVLALAAAGGPLPADEGRPAAGPPPGDVAGAVDRGLEWLAARQKRDGSFGTNVPVATTGLAGLAFLSHGDPRHGKYTETIQKAARYLLKLQERTGYISEPRGHGNNSRMHGHGYATLFLAELLGMWPEGEEDLRDGLDRAVRIIHESQSKEGGWLYEPRPEGDEASITVTQVQALRAARNAGLKVRRDTIDRAIKYIKRCSNPDGSIRYSLSYNQTYSSFSLTAAGVSVMEYLGEHNVPEVRKGLAYLAVPFEKGTPRPPPPDGCDFLSYQEFYAVLAFFHAGGEPWARYGRVIRDEILRRRQQDGSWPDRGYGPELDTAFSTLTLQVPKQYLPIFQR